MRLVVLGVAGAALHDAAARGARDDGASAGPDVSHAHPDGLLGQVRLGLDRARLRDQRLSLSTVYRTLSALKASGAVREGMACS